jgi:hypothetical protein
MRPHCNLNLNLNLNLNPNRPSGLSSPKPSPRQPWYWVIVPKPLDGTPDSDRSVGQQLTLRTEKSNGPEPEGVAECIASSIARD